MMSRLNINFINPHILHLQDPENNPAPKADRMRVIERSIRWYNKEEPLRKEVDAAAAASIYVLDSWSEYLDSSIPSRCTLAPPASQMQAGMGLHSLVQAWCMRLPCASVNCSYMHQHCIAMIAVRC